MNKTTAMFFCATVMTAMASAQTPETTQRADAPKCLKSLQAKTQHRAPAKGADGWKFDVSASDIISEKPAGDSKMMVKGASYYTNSIFGTLSGSSDAIPCPVVEDGTGAFYIYNPYTGLASSSYLKGQITGDQLTFNLPQAVYTDSDGVNDYVYVAQMCYYDSIDEESGIYKAYDGETTLKFTRQGEKWVMEAPEEINDHPVVMGLVAADDGTWCIYSDWAMTLSPLNEKVVSVPTTITPEKFAFTFTGEDGSRITGKFVNVGYDGDDVYVQGISEAFPEAWIKGTIDGATASFASGQYLGADEMTNKFGYLIGAKANRVHNEEYDFWYTEYEPTDNLTFSYDVSSRSLASSQSILITGSPTATSGNELFDMPIICLQGEVTDFTPATPIFGLYSEYNDAYGSGSLYFDFPTVNREGQLLNPDNLYYRIIVDDEPLTFYADEYGLAEDTEEIPFNFSNMKTLGFFGTGNTTHFFQFPFTGFESMAVQTLYKDGDSEYLSDILQIVGETTGIGVIEAETAATEWYDLAGMRVKNPTQGIYVKRMTMTDGTVKTVKTVVR